MTAKEIISRTILGEWDETIVYKDGVSHMQAQDVLYTHSPPQRL